MKRYEVIENNGGGLILVVFDENDKVEYIHTGYEYIGGNLKEDIEALENGADPVKEWEGNCGGIEYEFGDVPQELYDNITSYDCGWSVIADNDGEYPNVMGEAGRREFGYLDEKIKIIDLSPF